MSHTKEYEEYLKSEQWFRYRKIIHDLYKVCNRCGNNHNLHVHHGNYDHLTKEKYNDLFLLCSECHLQYHSQGKRISSKSTRKFIFEKNDKFKHFRGGYIDKQNQIKQEIKEGKNKEKKEAEIALSIEAIKNGIKFKNSGVKSLKYWKMAKRILKNTLKICF